MNFCCMLENEHFLVAELMQSIVDIDAPILVALTRKHTDLVLSEVKIISE